MFIAQIGVSLADILDCGKGDRYGPAAKFGLVLHRLRRLEHTVDKPVEKGADKLPLAAEEKLDQIKDLLITAEAIGEANLDRHFDRVSQRQRELIREFFDQAMPGQDQED